jgi:hypothetical protein
MGGSRLVGWRVRSTLSGGGTFFCPLEGADPEVRRWLAPFGFPILAYHHLGDYVRCCDCQQTFTDDVLEILTTEELAASLERAAVSLFSVIVARSGDSDLCRVTAERELRRFVRHPFAAHVSFQPPGLVEVVETLGATAVHMEEVGRRDMFAAAVRVAHSEGGLTGSAFAALHAAGGALRLPMSVVRSLIVTAGVAVTD